MKKNNSRSKAKNGSANKNVRSKSKTISIPSRKKIMDQIKDLNDDPILLEGYDDYIIGHDLLTNEILYDGYGIVNLIADNLIKQDKRDKEPARDWEDYYDQAMEYVQNGLVESASVNVYRKGKWVDLNAGRPKPRILMFFLN